MDTMLEFFLAFLKKKKEPASVLFFKEDIIPGASSQDNMIAGARIMESFLSCHVGWIKR
jgi:hypothetical protein